MRFIVEKTDPHATHPHLTDESHECETAAEAGRQLEDLCPVDAEDITDCLWRGQSILHVDDDGIEYSAVPAGPQKHLVRLRITINGVEQVRDQLRAASAALCPWLEDPTWAFPSWSPAWRPFDWSVDS